MKTLKTFSSKIAALLDMKPVWKHDKICFQDVFFAIGLDQVTAVTSIF